MRLASTLFVLSLAASSCGSRETPPRAPSLTQSSPEDALARVAFIHGGAGPWAVLGYRMGEAALTKLGLPRGSFDLVVVHHTPQEVQYSCIADGAAAATGASMGKLNLSLVSATEAEVATTYENRKTHASVTLRPAPAFVAKFRDVPREQLAAAGREVITMPDDALFVEVKASP